MVLGPLRAHVRFLLKVFLVFAVVLTSRSASAQLHWDVGLSGGPMRRVLIAGNASSSMGGTAVLEGHVALFPLLRIGGYATFEGGSISSEPVSRYGTSFGFHAKIATPGMPRSWKGSIFTGLGYAFFSSGAYERDRLAAPLAVPSATGGMLEVPLGFQAGYKVSRRVLLLFQLGVRFGFAQHGDLFDRRPAHDLSTGNSTSIPSAGAASLAPFLLMGASFDR